MPTDSSYEVWLTLKEKRILKNIRVLKQQYLHVLLFFTFWRFARYTMISLTLSILGLNSLKVFLPVLVLEDQP